MKKAMVLMFFIVLLATTALAINSKSLQVPEQYATNLLNITNPATCDVSFFPDHQMTSIEYLGRYYAVIPDSQPVVIDSSDDGCTPIVIDAESNLTSPIETFENYFIYLFDANKVRVSKFDGSTVTTLYTESFDANFSLQGVGCAKVLDQQHNRCYWLDTNNTLHVMSIINDTNISVINVSTYEANQPRTHPRRTRTPSFANMDSTVHSKRYQLMFIEDTNSNKEEGIRIINLDDYSTVDVQDDIVSITTTSYNNTYLNNPIAYGDISQIEALYVTGMETSGLNQLVNPRLKIFSISAGWTDLTPSLAVVGGSYPRSVQDAVDDGYSSSLSNNFVLNNGTQTFVCSYLHSMTSDGSAPHQYPLCYDRNSGATYTSLTFDSYGSVESDYNYIYPNIASFQIELNTGNYEGEFWSLLYPGPYRLCSEWFNYGEQEEQCSYLPADSLNTFGSQYKPPQWFPTFSGNRFNTIESPGRWLTNYYTETDFISAVVTGSNLRAQFFEDLNGDGLGDYVYTLTDGSVRFVYTTYSNRAPTITSIKVNADSTRLCKNFTYSFDTYYQDAEGDEQEYRYKCDALDSWSSWNNKSATPIEIDCLIDLVGSTRFYIELREEGDDIAHAGASMGYTAINGLEPECSLPGSGTTTGSIEVTGNETTTDGTIFGNSESFGLNELGEDLGLTTATKGLFAIIIIGTILVWAFINGKDRYGNTNIIVYGAGVFISLIGVYFFYKIGWISGFFLTLITMGFASFIVYAMFAHRGV